MIHPQRVRHLNDHEHTGDAPVVYWMQAAQRAHYNHALEYAIDRANVKSAPLWVYFGLTDDYPSANIRHYAFMIEGLKETAKTLKDRGVDMVVQKASPEKGIVKAAAEAGMVVVDRGYTKRQKRWRQYAAEHLKHPVVQVETNVVVPVETASPKEEYAARTIRPKIHKVMDDFMIPPEERELKRKDYSPDVEPVDIDDVEAVLDSLDVDRSVKPVSEYKGGASHALDRLDDFINNRLDEYDEGRNDPNRECLSNMSPYLHFGQVSPLYVALMVQEAQSPGTPAYLEELIVRRELAMNFVFYNPDYDNIKGIPEWCRKTLEEHAGDEREYVYSREDLENGRTRDKYWNAAQAQMTATGKMHGYMRMYWGKKILEWSDSPKEAFETALYLNDKYHIDGRDPNGFTGVAWCFGKHDQPWKERAIFGKVRYMNARGLKRKFDADKYADGILKK